MPILNLRRFANVDVLKSIRDDNLLALLEPDRDYLIGRGFSWPNGAPLDYPVLCEILVNPDEHIPDRLVNALYLVSEMATEPGMDDLLDIAQEHGIELTNGSDPTPADVAVEMWLKHPELLEEKHGEQFIFHPRSMESFQGRAPGYSY